MLNPTSIVLIAAGKSTQMPTRPLNHQFLPVELIEAYLVTFRPQGVKHYE